MSAASATDGRYLLLGGSRGLGAAVSAHLAPRVARLLCVSRSPAAAGTWIEADLATAAGLDAVARAVGEAPLDALLYMGGTWEAGAFTDAYAFSESPRAETDLVLAVNLVAPIELVKRLAPNLAQAPNPRAIFVGALYGPGAAAPREVANTASKFGLTGAVEAMRAATRGSRIGFTVINPGNVATDEVESDIAEGRFGPQTPIPLSDFIAVVDCALAMSPASEISELNLGQRDPG